MINLLPKLSIKNKNIINQATKVGCYHCCKIFTPAEITNFTDNDQTAICPFCSVDCVVTEDQGLKLSEEFLKKARNFWFGD